MTDTASLVYEPLNEYKPLWLDIGTVDGPLEYFRIAGVRLPLPFSTRMTVVRLKNGDLAYCVRGLPRWASAINRNDTAPRITESVPLCPHRRVVAGVSRCRNMGVSRCASACTGARYRRAVQERPWVQAPDEWQDEIEQTVVPGGIFVATPIARSHGTPTISLFGTAIGWT
jgi:hypothetical protein